MHIILHKYLAIVGLSNCIAECEGGRKREREGGVDKRREREREWNKERENERQERTKDIESNGIIHMQCCIMFYYLLILSFNLHRDVLNHDNINYIYII